MNTSQRGQRAQGGVILPSYTDLIPEARVTYVTKEAKHEAYAKAFVRVAASLYYPMYHTGILSWAALTEDSVKLLALQALNMVMLTDRARINKEQALRNKQIELVEKTRQTNPLAQNAVQKAPTPPQLVRTVSAPVNEGLKLIGQPPVTPLTHTMSVTASGTLIISPGPVNQAIKTILNQRQKEMTEQAEKSQKEALTTLEKQALDDKTKLLRQILQPGTSNQVVAGMIKLPGSPNQEQQGKCTQSITINEIRERIQQIKQDDTLKEIANKSLNIKKLTRAQLNKLTNDPKIKEQVLSQFK